MAVDTFPWFVNDRTCARSRQDTISHPTQQQEQQQQQQQQYQHQSHQKRHTASPTAQTFREATAAVVNGEKACGTGSTGPGSHPSSLAEGTLNTATSPTSHQCTEPRDQPQQQQQGQGVSYLMPPRRPEGTTTGLSDNNPHQQNSRQSSPGSPGAHAVAHSRDQIANRRPPTSTPRSGFRLQLPPLNMGASDVRNILNPLDQQHRSPALGLPRHSGITRGRESPSIERPASGGSGLARSPADGVMSHYSTSAMASPSYPFPAQLPSPSTAARLEESTSPHTTASAAQHWQQQRQLPAMSVPNTPQPGAAHNLPPSRDMGPDRIQRSFSLSAPITGARSLKHEHHHNSPASSSSWGPEPSISALGVPRRPSPLPHGPSPIGGRTVSQPLQRQSVPPLAGGEQLNPARKRSRGELGPDTSNLYRGGSEETNALPGLTRGPSLLYNQMLKRGGDTRQSMVLIPQGGGQIECTVDLKQGSIAADEKRRRNAEASKRFRERKKDHNLQTDQELRESQRQLRAISQELDYWRDESRRLLNMMAPAMRHEAERTAPPMPQYPSESSGDDHSITHISEQQGGSQRSGRASSAAPRGRGRRPANPSSHMSTQGPQGRQSEGDSPAYSDMSSVGQEPPARRRRTDEMGSYLAYGTPSQSPQAPAPMVPHPQSGTATPSPRPHSNGGPPPPAGGSHHPSLPPLNPGLGFLPPPPGISYRGPTHPGMPLGTPPASHAHPPPLLQQPGQPLYPPMSRAPVETGWATGPSG